MSGLKKLANKTHDFKPKYQQIVDSLVERIMSGQLAPGKQLPSEAMLVRQFATSRITVGRAMRELQQRGLIERIAGSGSYVRSGRGLSRRTLFFGLLIPDFGETEIFEPICRGIATAPEAGEHMLLWGHADAAHATRTAQALQLCEQYIARQVNGVFFAPLEYEADVDHANRRVLSRLARAKIPVVLLDKRPNAPPQRGRPDLVGINNRQAGYIATEHLIRLGSKRIGFLSHHASAAAINQRFAGYREALNEHGLGAGAYAVAESNAESLSIGNGDLDAWVCLNDRVAALLMRVLLSRGVRIPEDVRIVGIDDVSYAGLLPVPLTTVRQPCREIGAAALSAMLERIARPRTPPRDVLFDGELVIRKSCGAGQ